MIIPCTYHAYFDFNIDDLKLLAKLNLLTGVITDFVLENKHINELNGFKDLQLHSQTISFSYLREDYEFDIEMDINKVYKISDFHDIPLFRQILLEHELEEHTKNSVKIKL